MSTEAKPAPTLPLVFHEFNSPIADTGDYDGIIQIKDTAGRVLAEHWNPDEAHEEAFRRFISACNSHSALVAALEWRPISTAPRDGSHILVADLRPDQTGFGLFAGVRIPWMAVAHWWHVEGEEGFYLSTNSSEEPVFATHWRSLVAADAALKAAKGEA